MATKDYQVNTWIERRKKRARRIWWQTFLAGFVFGGVIVGTIVGLWVS